MHYTVVLEHEEDREYVASVALPGCSCGATGKTGTFQTHLERWKSLPMVPMMVSSWTKSVLGSQKRVSI